MAAKTKRIYFPKELHYGTTVYDAGKVYDLPVERGYADRWLKRGCVEVTEENKHLYVKQSDKKDVEKKKPTKPEPKAEESTGVKIGEEGNTQTPIEPSASVL